MRFLLLNVFFLFSLVIGALCQTKIKGRIIASDGSPIPFGNVILLDLKDSSFVKGAMAREAGRFEIDNINSGSYFLQYSAMGFKTWNSSAIDITDVKQAKDLDAQVLEEDVQLMQEMVVKSDKLLYQQEIDRTVINIQNSILTKGSSILQVLERSPGVVVDRQNNIINLNGKNGVAIMINGKIMRMPASEITNMLEGMSANNIDKIEIINAPPAKYDAEGTGGMINIVVKKNEDYGTNGSVSITGGYGYKEKAIISTNINHRNKWVNIYGSYSYTYDKGYWGLKSNGKFRFPFDTLYKFFDYSQKTSPVRNIQNATIGLDYYVTKKTTIGVSSILSYNNESYVTNTESGWLINHDSVFFKVNVDGKNQWRSAINNINIEKVIGESDKLTVDFDYLYYKTATPSSYRNSYLDKEGNDTDVPGSIAFREQKIKNETPFNIFVYNADYEKKINSNIKLESGFKSSNSLIENTIAIRLFEDGMWGNSTDPNANYKLRMTERIDALHSSLKIEIDSININLGMRYEHTKTDLVYNINTKENIRRRYGNFFPSVLVSKKFSKENSIRLSYTKRISRPSYTDIASNVYYTDIYTLLLGNPALRPVITHNLQAQHQYKQYLFSVLLSKDINPIVHYQQTESPSDSIFYTMPQNLLYQKNINFQVTAPLEVAKWWKMESNISCGWKQYETTHLVENFRKTFFQFNFNTMQTFEFPQSIRLEISGFYSLRDYIGIVRRKSLGVINLGIRKDLKNNRGSILLSVNDLLKTMHYRIILDMPQNPYSMRVDVVDGMPESRKAQIIKLTYTKSFGNSKISARKQAERGSKDERSRMQ